MRRALSTAELREAAALLAELDARRSQRECLYWLTRCTRTKDEQADIGVDPYRPFPKRPYFGPLIELFNREPIVMLQKSRTMMASWLVAGWCTHMAATQPATRVVFQSADEEKSVKLVEYCKTLWEQSTPAIRQRWPLARPMARQGYATLEFADGSAVVGIVGRADKVRSEHPTIYVADEAAFIVEFEASWAAAAATRAPHMIALSSVQPSEFCSLVSDAQPCDWPGYNERAPRRTDGVSDPVSDTWLHSQPCYGLTLSRTGQGWAVPRAHYAADPSLTPATVDALRAASPTPARWRQEMEIVPDALEGQLVYPEFSPAIHVIDDDQIPRRLTRYMAIDPHPRTPHAMLWTGVDSWGDVWVYRELWPSVAYARTQNPRDDERENEFTTKEYAETIAHLEGCSLEWRREHTDLESAVLRMPDRGGERIVCRYMDVAGKGFKVSAEGAAFESYATRYAKYGITCADPIRWHSKGEDAIRDLLRCRRHEVYGDWPRIHIARSCRELILEISRHKYAPMRGGGEKELPQSGSAVRTHLLDCLRYLATAQLQWSPVMAS